MEVSWYPVESCWGSPFVPKCVFCGRSAAASVGPDQPNLDHSGPKRADNGLQSPETVPSLRPMLAGSRGLSCRRDTLRQHTGCLFASHFCLSPISGLCWPELSNVWLCFGCTSPETEKWLYLGVDSPD